METNKMIVLGLIYKHRDILFGKFSSTLTHEIKAAKWKEITDELSAAGLYSKDWKYLRDTTWQNWRKRALEKKDNRLQSGSSVGKKFKYDESDELIIEIVNYCKNSLPVIEGSNIPESSRSQDIQVTINSSEFVDTSVCNAEMDTSMANNGDGRDESFYKNRTRLVSSSEYDDELHILKKQKLEAEIHLTKAKTEIAKRERYKLDLELLKLEKELQIRQPSSFTMRYYTLRGNTSTVRIKEQIEESYSEDENE